MSDVRDAIVIGGGVGGLVAATYLARAGKRVTLLEAQDWLGGSCAMMALGEGFSASLGAQTFYALDPRVVKDLKLARHGLKFAVRDMALVGLRSDGKHIVLQRNVHATAANIAVHSQRDAGAWPLFRRDLFDLARALRPFWFGEEEVLPKGEMKHRIDRLARTSALAWLDSWFESDALKAALCFDAADGGTSPVESGSALTLLWRAAQEMSGLQGAVSQVAGGTLIESLAAAARKEGVGIQTGKRVTEILSDGAAVSGVRLENGDVHMASRVLATLSRGRVLSKMMPVLTAGIAQTVKYARGSSSTGEARIFLTLRGSPIFGGVAIPDGARLIVSENVGAEVAADIASRAQRLCDDPPMEIVILSVADGSLAPAGQHIVSILLRPVPRNPPEGWHNLKTRLAERAVQALERLAPGTAAKIVTAKVLTPDELGEETSRAPVTSILAEYETRIKSPLQGLLFCGADAEPLPAISGRAARIAAAIAVRK